MLKPLIGLWCSIVLTAALYTGVTTGPFRFFTTMTGFLEPHYGYSAYAISVLLFLAPHPALRWVAAGALLLSGNRASWVGGLAGALWRRPVLALALGLLAAVGGYAWKPRTDNDSVRILIWRSALREAAKHPEGIGRGQFIAAVDGYAATKAHSDVLQLWVEGGAALTVYVLAAFVLALWFLPPSPAKDAIVCLSVQSVIDNRLHNWACALLYAAVWIAALWEARLALPARKAHGGVAELVQ